MSRLGYIFEFDILRQLHVLSVDAKNFHTADFIRDTNIDFSIETSSTTKGRVDSVRSVSGADDNNLSATFSTVHKGEHLGDDTLLDLTLRLLSVWRNRIDFIDEDNRGGVLLTLLESLAQVLLGLTLHLGHDLWSVKEEEEGTGLVSDSLGNEGLTRTWRSEQENTLGRLHTESLEKLRMSQRELNHLTNLRELFTDATNIIISNIFGLFFVVTVDRITLVEKRSLW